MTNLDKIITEVLPTSFSSPQEKHIKQVEEIYTDLIDTLKLNFDENTKFNEGISLQKLNNTNTIRILLETVLYIIENSKKIQLGDKNDDALYQYNKKIVRDLATSFFTVLNNYQYNDREVKVMLLGKTIQSMYGNRY